jgi:hypothetical protein
MISFWFFSSSHFYHSHSSLLPFILYSNVRSDDFLLVILVHSLSPPSLITFTHSPFGL